MPPGLYGLCAFGAYAGLIDDAAMHAAEEGAERRFKLAPVVWIFGLMAGGSLTAAAAGLMLCFCENPVFCLAAFALPGAGLSPVVPLLLSRAGRLDGVSSAAAASLISVLAYGGLLVVPPVIGLIAEQAGLEAALLTVPVLCAVVVAGSLLFRQK